MCALVMVKLFNLTMKINHDTSQRSPLWNHSTVGFWILSISLIPYYQGIKALLMKIQKYKEILGVSSYINIQILSNNVCVVGYFLQYTLTARIRQFPSVCRNFCHLLFLIKNYEQNNKVVRDWLLKWENKYLIFYSLGFLQSGNVGQ